MKNRARDGAEVGARAHRFDVDPDVASERHGDEPDVPRVRDVEPERGGMRELGLAVAARDQREAVGRPEAGVGEDEPQHRADDGETGTVRRQAERGRPPALVGREQHDERLAVGARGREVHAVERDVRERRREAFAMIGRARRPPSLLRGRRHERQAEDVVGEAAIDLRLDHLEDRMRSRRGVLDLDPLRHRHRADEADGALADALHDRRLGTVELELAHHQVAGADPEDDARVAADLRDVEGVRVGVLDALRRRGTSPARRPPTT